MERLLEMRIRKFTESDYQNLYDTISDPDVMSYIEPPYSAEKTKAFLFKAGLCDNPQIFAAENDEGNYVGYVIYHDYDNHNIEIGWLLKRSEWGKGYAKKLTNMMIEQAKLEEKSVIIECSPEQLITKYIITVSKTE
ncbi:MAG: GNAT family N-acetyltransferase [Lachnospiraceae bacterium]|nr:GNAT family N-acetyltransferase [Lachnospiraceae bacterium]